MVILMQKNMWPILGAAVLAVSALSVLGASTGTPAYQQRLQEQGYPTGLEDLDRWYPPVPDEENAALLYMRAVPPPKLDEDSFEVPPEEEEAIDFDLLPVEGNAELPPPGEAIPPEMETTIREYLALKQDALDLLYAGAKLDRAHYHFDWANPAAPIEHSSRLRTAERMLHVDALRHVLDENPAGVTEALITMVQVADSLAGEPVEISQLVFNGLAGIVLSAIEEVLSRIELSPEQLQRLQHALNRESFTTVRPMQRAIAGEAAFIPGIEEMLLIDDYGERRPDVANMPHWAMLTSLRITGMSPFRDLADARTLSRILGLGNIPAPELARFIQAGDDAGDRAQFFNVSTIEGSVAARAVFSRYFLGDWMYVSMYRTSLTTMAMTELAQAALAVERYRHAENELPSTLDTLVPAYLPAVPIDPFGGAPIPYRLTDDGYLLYSVSFNGTDDGGIPPQEGKGFWDGDLLFEVRTEGRS